MQLGSRSYLGAGRPLEGTMFNVAGEPFTETKENVIKKPERVRRCDIHTAAEFPWVTGVQI